METGTQVSHYRILRKLGAGGMGEVYQAEDLNLKRTVALKFLLPLSVGDEKALKRFKREAQYAASFQDPHIATVYEIGETEGQVFIAMEYIEGQTLRDRIRERPLSAGEITRFTDQMLRALEKAHQRKIIHRDIKSANILINQDGDVKILDFGLAKAVPGHQFGSENMDAGATVECLTAEQAVVGTIDYMSPEILKGMDADERSDLYAVGIVLFEMVTGRVPFGGVTFAEKIAAKLSKTAVTSDDPTIPPVYRPILFRALHPDRERRYASARELLNDIQAVSVGQSPSAATSMVDLTVTIAPSTSMTPSETRIRPASRMAPSLLVLAAITLPSAWLAGGLTGGGDTGEVLVGLAGLVLPPAVIGGLAAFVRGRQGRLSGIAAMVDRRVWPVAVVALAMMLCGASRLLEIVHFSALGEWRYLPIVRREVPSRDIVLIRIDDASRQQFLKTDPGNATTLSGWRKFHGRLLEQIMAHGPPRSIAFDIYFSDPNPEFDAPFAQAISAVRQRKVPVILGQIFYPAERRFSVTVDPIRQAVSNPEGPPSIGQNFAQMVPYPQLPLAIRKLTPRPDEAALDVEVFPSSMLLMLTGGVFDEAWVVAGRRIDAPAESIEVDPAYVGRHQAPGLDFESITINFPTEPFVERSYFDVFSGQVPEDDFRDKLVIIGSAYEEFEASTEVPPFDQPRYRFQILASALSTVKQRSYISHSSPEAEAFLLLFGCYTVFAVALALRDRHGWLRLALPVTLFASVLLFFLLAWTLFRVPLIWFETGYATLASVTTGLLLLFNRRSPEPGNAG
ncbi:MAG: protein kinase [Acidobacteria bacterium]|nr:protein kinase [Acidobacteriota bacterium]